MIRSLFAVALACLFAATVRAGQGQVSIGDAGDLRAARDAAEAAYRDDLDKLARWCDDHELAEAAKLMRGWLPARDPLKSYIFKLPESLDPPEHVKSAGSSGHDFWSRFVKRRQSQADTLFALAKQAHAERQFSLAFDLVREACRENPDHAEARAILGYRRYNGGWALPDTARRLAAGQVYHEMFGWLPAGHAEQYEQGRRYARGKWITADEDERRHASIRSGWRVDSEHYAVTTNHSLEEGARLSRRLEALYDVWRHVFVDYYTPEPAMQRWFDRAVSAANNNSKGVTAPVVRRQHQVVYFRNRDEYKNALRALQPQIDMTLGIYFAQPRTAYFFADDEQYAGTLLHEGTHQLFQETRQTGRDIGATSNFWLVEAVACHMESLVEHEHWYTLGGAEAGRVPAARKRLLEDRFYVPLGEVAALGMRELQRDPRLPKIYSQISGQAWFFLHADGGRYRRPLVNCLVALYTNRADTGTLAKHCDRSYEQLDEEYARFIRANGR